MGIMHLANAKKCSKRTYKKRRRSMSGYEECIYGEKTVQLRGNQLAIFKCFAQHMDETMSLLDTSCVTGLSENQVRAAIPQINYRFPDESPIRNVRGGYIMFSPGGLKNLRGR